MYERESIPVSLLEIEEIEKWLLHQIKSIEWAQRTKPIKDAMFGNVISSMSKIAIDSSDKKRIFIAQGVMNIQRLEERVTGEIEQERRLREAILAIVRRRTELLERLLASVQ